MSDATECVLAIDLGTSGPKVALVNTSGAVVDTEYEPTELILTPDGGVEQDPDDWWRAITMATRRMLARGAVTPDEVIGVCCTAQWLGTVAVDGDGHHLMNALIWMDARGAEYMPEVTGGAVTVQGYEPRKITRWIRVSGGAPGHSGKDPTAHILWIKHHRPDVYRATRTFLEPKDYLNLRLTGRAVASVDSIAGHFVTDNRDLDHVVYDEQLVHFSELDRETLPELVRAVDVIGGLRPDAADELGLPAGIDVVAGTPDVQSATLGSGALADFSAHLYLGTSSWITCHVPFKKTDLFSNMASLPAAIPNRYFVGNDQETAGACLGWLRDNVLWPDDALGTGPAAERRVRAHRRARGDRAGRQRLGDLHAVAERRADPGRRSHDARIVGQPVALDDAGATRCEPCSKASRTTRSGSSPRSRSSSTASSIRCG